MQTHHLHLYREVMKKNVYVYVYESTELSRMEQEGRDPAINFLA